MSKPTYINRTSRYEQLGDWVNKTIEIYAKNDLTYGEKRPSPAQCDELLAIKKYYGKQVNNIFMRLSGDDYIVTAIIPFVLKCQKALVLTSSDTKASELEKSILGSDTSNNLYVDSGILSREDLDGYRPIVSTQSKEEKRKTDFVGDMLISGVDKREDLILSNRNYGKYDLVIVSDVGNVSDKAFTNILQLFSHAKCVFLLPSSFKGSLTPHKEIYLKEHEISIHK